MNITFTHYWVPSFGWETTIFLPSDFVTVEHFGRSERDGDVFIAACEKGTLYVFKGKYN